MSAPGSLLRWLTWQSSAPAFELAFVPLVCCAPQQTCHTQLLPPRTNRDDANSFVIHSLSMADVEVLAAKTAPAEVLEAVEKLSIKALKQLIDAAGIDRSGCVEKVCTYDSNNAHS